MGDLHHLLRNFSPCGGPSHDVTRQLLNRFRLRRRHGATHPQRYSHADEHLKTIRALRGPSVIAVVSASRLFLDVARSVLAPAMGSRHQLREILLPDESPAAAKSADLVFCDSIAKKHIRRASAIHYRLLSPESVEDVAASMRQR